MKIGAYIQLSAMMFIEFFIWSAWFVTLGIYIGVKGFDAYLGWAYSTTAWAAIISSLFIGMIADRFFSAQKVMGVLHLLGAVLMFAAARAESAPLFVGLLLAYAITYMPTIGLAHTIAFSHMTNIKTQFPLIRALGTIGWIVAAFFISRFSLEPTAVPMYIAAGGAAFLGLFSFFLPSTPPQSVGKKVAVKDILGLDALKLLTDRSFGTLLFASLLFCIPLSFYFAGQARFLTDLGVENVASKLSLGQASEIVFVLALSVCMLRLGVKKTLLLGMGAWTVRYVFWAYADNESLIALLYGGILLHGISYAFFFVAGPMVVQRFAPKALQASAQNLYVLATYGVGTAIGSLIAGRAITHFEWRAVWLIPAVGAAVITVAFALLFKEKAEAVEQEMAPATAEE